MHLWCLWKFPREIESDVYLWFTHFPSPTVGVFPTHVFDWRSAYANNDQQNVKEEENLLGDFSFKTQENKRVEWRGRESDGEELFMGGYFSH